MTQVWMYRHSDTDIHLFNREDHIDPSVTTTYSRCMDVKIEKVFDRDYHTLTYTVTGIRDSGPFTETLVFRRLPVWTEPSHL